MRVVPTQISLKRNPLPVEYAMFGIENVKYNVTIVKLNVKMCNVA